MTTPVDVLHPEVETLSRNAVEDYQAERLARQVAHAASRSAFFREKWDAAGVGTEIGSIEDLVKLPTTNKSEFRDYRAGTNDPFAGTLCVDVSQLSVVNHSTGTTGFPNLYGLTEPERHSVARMWARSAYITGVRSTDHVLAAGGPSWHGAVIGQQEGLRELGATVYFFGTTSSDSVAELFELGRDLGQMTVMRAGRPEAEVEYLRRAGIDPRDVFPNVRQLWSIVDASPARRRMLYDLWNAPLKNQYGSGDQYWISGECPLESTAYHVPEDYFVFEVLDPNTGQVVPPGGWGILHITNLWSESFPYFRYCMEDVVQYRTDPCECGRTSMRLSIRGRMAWSVDVTGRRIFSQEVENVLWELPGLELANYQIIRRSDGVQGLLEVRVAPAEDAGVAAAEVETALSAAFAVPARVQLVAAGGIGKRGLKMDRMVTE